MSKRTNIPDNKSILQCIAVFQIPENKTSANCTCIGVTLNGEWKKYYEKIKLLDFFNSIVE